MVDPQGENGWRTWLALGLLSLVLLLLLLGFALSSFTRSILWFVDVLLLQSRSGSAWEHVLIIKVT